MLPRMSREVSPPERSPEPLDALLARTFRMLRHTWSQHGADLGLAPHQGRALRIIGSEGPLRLSALAEQLHIAPRSATEVADALQERGLIERSPDPDDRRATLVSITPAGRDIAEQVATARRAQAEVFFGRLSAQDRVTLQRILSTLSEPGE